MNRILMRLLAIILLIGGVLLGWFIATSNDTKPFQLGLDLSGGTHLEYKALVDDIPEVDRKSSMEALRDVIERRINLFGVSEPSVQTETARLGQDEKQYRLVVELPGVTDVQQAIDMIGQTPLLEFKEQNPDLSPEEFQQALEAETVRLIEGQLEEGITMVDADFVEPFVATELTGAYLKRSRLEFQQAGAGSALNTGAPIIALEFTKEGGDLFAEITERNVGNIVAIYLDGALEFYS